MGLFEAPKKGSRIARVSSKSVDKTRLLTDDLLDCECYLATSRIAW
jgi:hypothetical protein